MVAHRPADISALARRLADIEHELARRIEETQELYRTGLALSSEQDMGALQSLILTLARRLTSADAGTLYIVQKEGTERSLLFSASQTASVNAAYQRQTIPLNLESIAGYVATTGIAVRLEDAYALPDGVPYRFNATFDRRFGYRTRSLLAIPMADLEGTIVGVLQLINRTSSHGVMVPDAECVAGEAALRPQGGVVPFTAEDEHIASALASQAAVALQNRMLLETNRLYRKLQEYVREVHKVTAAAADVETGTFLPESLAEVAGRDDALGQLARVFQHMAREVHARETRLRREVEELRIEIDHTKRLRQVAEITETDFFVDLEAKARALRMRR